MTPAVTVNDSLGHLVYPLWLGSGAGKDEVPSSSPLLELRVRLAETISRDFAQSGQGEAVLLGVDGISDFNGLHLFAHADAAETWFEENDAKASPLSMRFWSEPHW